MSSDREHGTCTTGDGMANRADVALSRGVSRTQSTQATISTANKATQSTVRFFSNTASQTETKLSVTEADLTQRLSMRERLARRGGAVPDNNLDGTAVPGSSGQHSSSLEMMEEFQAISVEEEAAAKVSVAKKQHLAQLQLRGVDRASSSDEDAVVPKRFLLKERRKSQRLRRKLQVVRKMHRCLQERHDQTWEVLLNMLATSCARGCNCQGVLHRQPTRQSGSSLPRPAPSKHTQLADKPAVVRVVPQQLVPKETPSDALLCKEFGASIREEPALRVPNSVAGASIQQDSALGVQNNVLQEDLDRASQCGVSEIPFPFERANDQVHLGDGIFVSTARWEWLLKRERDSLFVREVTKAVWGLTALRGRSVTGTPCRRFLNSREAGTTPEKRALSPKKLDVVRSAFDHYIAQTKREEPAQKRRSKMNRFIADMLKVMK